MTETRTPPLPKPATPRSGLWLKIVNTLVIIGVFFVLYLLFSYAVQSFGLAYYLVFTLGILLLYYFVIAAHEIGHVVAGKFVGFQFRYLTIGWLKVESHNGKLALGRVSTRSLPGGLASMIPTDDRDLRRRLITMISGGPLANLFVAGLTALVYLSIPGGQQSVVALVFLAICTLSLTVFGLNLLATLTPFVAGGFPSDGRLILELLKKSPAADRMCASLAIFNASRSGLRPRDWNDGIVQQTMRPVDNTLAYLSGLSVTYYQALDRNEIDLASRWIDQIIEGLPRVPRAFSANFLLEVTYFEALYRHDAVAARAHFAQAKEGFQIDQATRARAEAAVLLAEGQFDIARDVALQGLALLDEMSDLGSRLAEKDWLQDIATQAQNALPISGS